ncbi:class I SAM-dependent methyltransferase [Pedobacter caeni]|uniref:Methyltransferase domain-containing protein n=1 Tax=Pedobacter caeni TaxID=288992 RepID=A0A1M5A772_9SPHI|nr:class I SAM-dependent methyltransferase [Pedobacter caeni]SHF26014.1 Methyltransferase domain-containing protein [Pedobacter caeni]
MSEGKSHWEKVYTTKAAHEVSWTQEVPKTSLDFINGFQLGKSAGIIDIGGGDSLLVDFLLAQGYQNITVLDISEAALERAKKRLGDQADLVKWLVSDITDFKPAETYDIWHDRATFHFLTTATQIEKYITIAKNCVRGYLTIGIFSKNGPEKCSGLEIRQYSEDELEQQFSESFQKLQVITEDHVTPFNTVQNFIFCSFKRI